MTATAGHPHHLAGRFTISPWRGAGTNGPAFKTITLTLDKDFYVGGTKKEVLAWLELYQNLPIVGQEGLDGKFLCCWGETAGMNGGHVLAEAFAGGASSAFSGTSNPIVKKLAKAVSKLTKSSDLSFEYIVSMSMDSNEPRIGSFKTFEQGTTAAVVWAYIKANNTFAEKMKGRIGASDKIKSAVGKMG
jgi:hypothetical protein